MFRRHLLALLGDIEASFLPVAFFISRNAWILLALAILAILLRRRWLPAARAAADHGFQLVCLLLLVPLFLCFLDAVFASPMDLAALGPTAIGVALLAIGLQAGPHLLDRLKSLGPLELFEQRAPELLQRLEKAIDGLDVDFERALRTPLEAEAEFLYQRVNMLLLQIELSGVEPGSEAAKKQLGKLLLKSGQLAATRGDWWRAKSRFERIRELVGADFEGVKVSYNLGRAYQQIAEERAGEERKALLKQAMGCFQSASQKDPNDPDSLFWLAYVQDDLNMLDLAIANNLEVLRRNHGDAAAKYNIAIARIKQGDHAAALRCFLLVTPNDRDGLETLRDAEDDDELKPLLNDPQLGPKARWWIRHHQDPLYWPD